jgi:hypothetical protein
MESRTPGPTAGAFMASHRRLHLQSAIKGAS